MESNTVKHLLLTCLKQEGDEVAVAFLIAEEPQFSFK